MIEDEDDIEIPGISLEGRPSWTSALCIWRDDATRELVISDELVERVATIIAWCHSWAGESRFLDEFTLDELTAKFPSCSNDKRDARRLIELLCE